MGAMDRRYFLRAGSLVLGGALAAASVPQLQQRALAARGPVESKPDYTLNIEPCSVSWAGGVTVKTTAYNGQVPGPLLRLREGDPVIIDVTNSSANADIVHWHGLAIDSLNDGAMEEGSPMIPPGGKLRYTFTPRPAGTRWYHTQPAPVATCPWVLTAASSDSSGGGKPEPGDYDQEIFLAIHHWEPSFVPMVETMRAASANQPLTTGSTWATSMPPSTSTCWAPASLFASSRASGC